MTAPYEEDTEVYGEEAEDSENEELLGATEDFSNYPQFITDDQARFAVSNKQVEFMLESLTRIGGEVCKLRAEVDGLLEQNHILGDTLKKLKDVIIEKGMLDLDEFQLACDVFEDSVTKPITTHHIKKMNH